MQFCPCLFDIDWYKKPSESVNPPPKAHLNHDVEVPPSLCPSGDTTGSGVATDLGHRELTCPCAVCVVVDPLSRSGKQHGIGKCFSLTFNPRQAPSTSSILVLSGVRTSLLMTPRYIKPCMASEQH